MEMKQARLADMMNVPEKREKDGKISTPAVLMMVCANGEDRDNIFFVADDILHVVQTTAGVVIKMQRLDVRFTYT